MEEIGELKTGDNVKLLFVENGESERMWVTITAIDSNNFEGVLNNIPYLLETISDGDKVLFKSENILGIW